MFKPFSVWNQERESLSLCIQLKNDLQIEITLTHYLKPEAWHIWQIIRAQIYTLKAVVLEGNGLKQRKTLIKHMDANKRLWLMAIVPVKAIVFLPK